MSLQGICKWCIMQRNLNKPCGIYAEAERKANNTSKSKQQFRKLSFDSPILKRLYFNRVASWMPQTFLLQLQSNWELLFHHCVFTCNDALVHLQGMLCTGAVQLGLAGAGYDVNPWWLFSHLGFPQSSHDRSWTCNDIGWSQCFPLKQTKHCSRDRFQNITVLALSD